jgi:hypothetical protein
MTADNSRNSHGMGIPDACVVEMSRVPEDLLCSICSELCADPVQTSCNHVFCRACIFSSVPVSGGCPLCRSLLVQGRLQSMSELNPILFRIWDKIKIRCPHAVPNCCEWKGSPADFEAHKVTCQMRPNTADPSTASVAEINDLKSQCAALRLELENLNQRLSQEQRERSRLARKNEAERQRLLQEIENARNRVDFDPNYRYDRFRVVELSQLISRHLEEKPHEIEANRIYNCVKNINDDRQRKWADNPKHLDLVRFPHPRNVSFSLNAPSIATAARHTPPAVALH